MCLNFRYSILPVFGDRGSHALIPLQAVHIRAAQGVHLVLFIDVNVELLSVVLPPVLLMARPLGLLGEEEYNGK